MPETYKSIPQGYRHIKAVDGFKGFTVGWAPTFIGYSAQGFGKFGFYEIFKDVYRGALGANAEKYQTLGFLTASACAEVIADCLLCPWEALKVRMQTAEPGAFTTNAVEGFNTIKANEGTNGFYKGIVPLWARQVPYTMVKFAAFENTVKWFYRNIFTKEKNSYSKSTQLMITFLSGYWAGIFCAVVSHPADTMVSKVNKIQNDLPFTTNAKNIYGEIGFAGLWKGVGARVIMVGTLTGLQWWIYDTFKVATGLQTTGGK
jgi:solute carrier family 25 phosphate transporter 3